MKRRTTKKGYTNTEKIVIGAGVIGGVWALWKYVIKDFISPDETSTQTQSLPTVNNTVPALVISPVQTVTTPQPIKPKQPIFDGSKVLRLNAPPSEELKMSKIAFNSQIEMARQRKSNSNLSPVTRKRLDTISKLTLLDTNTKFGKETENVAQIILGSKTFTYNGVKNQKIKMWESLGLKNPYSN
jgi:hypothetical protein